MNLNNLAGEKSDVRIQHASIVSGNLALVDSNNNNKSKQLLKKKKIRPHIENKTNDQPSSNNAINASEKNEKKQIQNEETHDKKGIQKSDKSNYLYFINFIFLFYLLIFILTFNK